jgi:hypothetical protein
MKINFGISALLATLLIGVGIAFSYYPSSPHRLDGTDAIIISLLCLILYKEERPLR